MEQLQIRRERAQNIWGSFERKFPTVAKAVRLDPAPSIGGEHIGGLEAAQEEVFTYACAATSPEVYENWGTFPPSGLLLIGSHGSGKTLLAHALATRAETAFLKVAVPRLVLEILHSGGKVGELVAAWPQVLEEMPPVTICFHELLFSQSAEFGAYRNDLPVGTIMDFLLDVVDRTIAVPSTLVVGTTSHPDALPRAFIAPGRFERLVEVTPLFPDDVVAALEIHARDAEKRAGRTLFDSVDWIGVVRRYSDPSTADWIRIMHAVLRRKARCEAAGEPVTPVQTRELQKEAERFLRAANRLPQPRMGTYV